MFISTMSDAEIQQEARRDFFELSTKVKLAADRFMHINCDLITKSPFQYNDKPICLIKKNVEKRKWRTRRSNTWTSYFRFINGAKGADVELQWFLYTPVYRTNGTEYIFQGSLNQPLAQRFTMHFIERYKERHLKPHGINIGAMPAPLYFQIHNPDCIMGKYYKASDIDIAEGKHKKFWIAPEGIYVTDYIDGMLTYITFMDKDNLSPLKKQVYQEEIVWDLVLRIANKKLSADECIGVAFSISSNPDIERIFEGFIKRNVEFDSDEGRQKLLLHAKEQIALTKEAVNHAKKTNELNEKMDIRKNLISIAFNNSTSSNDNT